MWHRGHMSPRSGGGAVIVLPPDGHQMKSVTIRGSSFRIPPAPKPWNSRKQRSPSATPRSVRRGKSQFFDVTKPFGRFSGPTKRHRRSNVGSEARQSLLVNKLLHADCRRPVQARSTPSHAMMHRQLVKRQLLNRPRRIGNRRINLHTR